MANGSLQRRIALGVSLALLAVPATVIADPNHDSVKGEGLNNPAPGFPIDKFEVNAKSDADGSNASGHAQFSSINQGSEKLRFRGDVQCLRVDGNIARLVMVITQSSNPRIPVGRLWRVDVEDHGKNEHGETVDEVRNGPSAAVDCSGFVNGDRTLTKGNIKVEDAS